MALRLTIEDEDQPRRWALSSGEQVLGSGGDCTIRLAHPTVSRRHARLRILGGDFEGVEIEDLGSRNGTWLGSRRLRGVVRVEPGSPLTFGGVSARLEAVAQEDLDAAVAFDSGASAFPLSNQGGSTVGAAPLDAFVLEELPRLLEVVAEGPGVLAVSQAVGAALFRLLPLKTLELRRPGEGVLFHASTGEDPGLAQVEEEGGLALHAGFSDPRFAAYYRPLLLSALRLVALGAGPSPAGAARRPTPVAEEVSPPSLPDPPTVVPKVLRLYESARKVARGEIGVLILGESGVGKEVLARFLHRASQRRDRPLVTLNCAALPRDLLEAELFGIEKGVATGVEARPGKFELADGGTLFLDELGDMALETQAKILRVLQEGEVQRLGGRRPRSARVRVLSATHRDPERLIEAGTFRLDLYHRIAGWTVEMPPLRRRRGDIPNLAAYFLEQEATRLGLRLAGISRGAIEALQAYRWPGNVRELVQEMARAALFLYDGDLLGREALSRRIRQAEASSSGSLEDQLRGFERELVEDTLDACEGRVAAAAEALGIPVSTLYRRLKALGIERDTTGSDREE